MAATSPRPQEFQAAEWIRPVPRQAALPRALTTVLAVVLDYVCILAGFVLGFLCYRLYHGSSWPGSTTLLLELTLQYWVVLILLARAHQLYNQSATLLQIRDTEMILTISCLCFLVLAVETYIAKLTIPRIALCSGWVFSVLFLLVQKHVSRRAFVKLRAAMATQRNVAIVGAGRDARRIFSYLNDSPDLGMVPVAFLDERGTSRQEIIYGHDYVYRSYAPVVRGELTEEMLREMNVSEIFIAECEISHHRMSEITSMAIENGADISFVGTAQPMSLQHHGTVHIMDGVMITSYSGLVSDRRMYYLLKRAFDIAGSLLLIAITAPLWILIALWVRKTSEGPVFFRQERTGWMGKPFRMYKFRTMYVNAPKYSRSPEESHDSRITSAGRFLRKASLDELPQLLNVLRGDMSLVGPRPEMPFITEEYDQLERRRLIVPQGLTGLWQLSADRKYSIHESLEYDLYYIENQGFFLDLAILLHTALFAMKGI